VANARRLSKNLILDVVKDATNHEKWQSISLVVQDGVVACQLLEAPEASWGAIWVGGIGNSVDPPIQTLFSDCAFSLAKEGVTSLRVTFRHNGHLQKSVYDVEAGLSYLLNNGVHSVALIGHSFGGAVVIRAATRISAVRTVVTLASQSDGADEVSCLGPMFHPTDPRDRGHRSALWLLTIPSPCCANTKEASIVSRRRSQPGDLPPSMCPHPELGCGF
jgi:acetyl esterase/lipase